MSYSFLETLYLLCICGPMHVCVCVYIGVHISVTCLSITSLACLSDILVPFQAIRMEVKLFSNKRREIKTGIKELAKTVSAMISYTTTFGPWSKIIFWAIFCSTHHEELYPFFPPPFSSTFSQFSGVLQQGRIFTIPYYI